MSSTNRSAKMVAKQTLLRDLPSVDRLLQMETTRQLLAQYGRSLTTEALRHALDFARQQILQGKRTAAVTPDQLIATAQDWLVELIAPTLAPVINGTGVIVHTNLGRAPLSEAALSAVHTVSSGYSTLEFDLESGKRGSRALHADQLLQRLTGAAAALVVNNNAAAVLLMLTALCRGKEVLISRSQLVEIGGGFRIPEVMAQSGATLVEVGTTNRTHLRDFANAITPETAAILVAHHSNYKIIGFTTEPDLAQLAELAHAHDIPLLYDQGSGALLDVGPLGLEKEPTVSEGLEAGVDLIAFSGDKLLGGPQAGILAGDAALIKQIKKHPLARAVRADKMALAALTATLTHFLKNRALTEVPVWRMMTRSLADIEFEAQQVAARLQAEGVPVAIVDGRSTVGGGSLPGTSLPTRLLSFAPSQVEQFATLLRQQPIPIIGRVQDDRFLIDLRTLLPKQVEICSQAFVQCWLVLEDIGNS